jgi:hypothetical protein
MPKIDGLPKTRPFLDGGGVLNTEGRTAMEQMESRIAITGSGSPENMVSSVSGGIYLDLLGTTGSIMYVKLADSVSGDDTRGWELV